MKHRVRIANVPLWRTFRGLHQLARRKPATLYLFGAEIVFFYTEAHILNGEVRVPGHERLNPFLVN